MSKADGQLFSDASHRLTTALEHVDLPDDVLETLKYPKAQLGVSIPVRMDNGELKIFPGYRVRYDDTRGPAKGGVRYHPGVSFDEVQSLAFWMTFKCAALNLPLEAVKVELPLILKLCLGWNWSGSVEGMWMRSPISLAPM